MAAMPAKSPMSEAPIEIGPLEVQALKEHLEPMPDLRSRVEQLIRAMRERERDLFYSAYPQTRFNPTEASRAAALQEVQGWREQLEAALTGVGV